MPVTIELIEILISVAPLLISITLARGIPSRINGWFVKVLGTSLLAILSIGILLMHLTASCASSEVACGPSEALIARTPGVIKSCGWCSRQAGSGLAEFLNQYEVDIQAFCTGICVVISLITILRFMRWAKHVLATRGE